MATITLRLDNWTRDELERLARANGTTISELLRSKIAELLGKDVPMTRSEAPRGMSMIQRRSLALQHEILAHLSSDEDEKARHRRQIQILENGFTVEYSDEFFTVGPELPPSECSLVWNILDMFSVLESSVERLSSQDLAKLGEHAAGHLSFLGFDANDPRESRLLDYTKYVIEDGRWENLADHLSANQERGNSHSPKLAIYQRMLRVFTPIWQGKLARGGGLDAHRFSVAELRQMLDAQRCPHNTD